MGGGCLRAEARGIRKAVPDHLEDMMEFADAMLATSMYEADLLRAERLFEQRREAEERAAA